MADCDKPPFEQLVESMSPALLGQTVGVRSEEAQKFTFAAGTKEFRSLLKDQLRCELDKFGSCLGLPSARVEAVKSAAEEDRGKQVDYLLLAWVESRGEQATVGEALRALYAADDTQTLEILVTELSDSGKSVQREVVISKKPSYLTEHVVIPSPPQTHFLAGDEQMKLTKPMANMTILPSLNPMRLPSESDLGTPVELPPEVSLQAPLEESLLAKEMVQPVEPSCITVEGDTKSAEAHVAMEEESWLGHSVETGAVVTAETDTHFEGKHGGHEMVSGERKMQRMQSDFEDLLKNMKRIESGLEEVKSEHRRESLYMKQRDNELDLKLQKLEEDNALLKSTVISLQEELNDTKEQLKKAVEEAEKLREDNSHLTDLLTQERARLQEEREKFREETDRMERRAATTEREKAELRESLEEQAAEWRSRQEQYERELTEMKASLALLKKEIQHFHDKNMTDSPDTSSQAESQGGETGVWTWKQKLGSGGFGEVFEAERTGCSDRFAAKRMTMNDSDLIDKQEEIVSAFFKEMKALKECCHPRVVKYVDRAIQNFNSGIHFYIIMEYVAQGSLSDLMKKEGRKLDELRIRKFTRQLLDGLLYLHQRSIIHRDIKCSNILLDENGDIKLADFGCVKFKKSKMNSGAKMTGTAWWMAPELIPGGRQSEAAASEKSDVWSVGATVVEMLTGKRPFAEHNEKMAVIFGLGNQSLSLDNLIHGPGFSDEAQLFLQLCINWEPSSRATVTELLSSSFVTT